MSANDRQEGGSHYQTGELPQHWDLAIMYKWDPFQYQITKYVMRWKDKHETFDKRLMDLKKARHFIDKYIENAQVYDAEHQARLGNMVPVDEEALGWQDENFKYEGWWGDGTMLLKCKKCGSYVKAKSPKEGHEKHGDCASRAYVNQ